MPAPTPSSAKPKKKADPKAKQLEHFKQAEKKQLAKQDRIQSWPKEHREAAQERIDANLSHIREEMKKLV
jgi:hypothetical protein